MFCFHTTARRLSFRAHCRFLLVQACVCLTPLVSAHADIQTFTVRPGDALSLLAHRFGVTVDELMQWNSLADDRIYPGQTLRVSGGTDAAVVYEVQTGDTLGAVAQQFGVSVEDLVMWNDGLEPDRIHVGQSLLVSASRHRIRHKVRPGETLSRIAQEHELRVDQILAWNPRADRHQIRAGQQLTLYSTIPASTSESVGFPYHGRLLESVQLSPHSGYVIRDRSRAYGTHETVRFITEAFSTVRKLHPDAPRVRVHDISRRRGGRMTGHRSHQSGRDADISFFLRRGCSADEGCPMIRANPQDLELGPQWTLLRHWLERGQLEAVFIDYTLVEALYNQAKKDGVGEPQLTRWFQFPRGRHVARGVIRHYRQHRDHMHVRFRCHESDEACQ